MACFLARPGVAAAAPEEWGRHAPRIVATPRVGVTESHFGFSSTVHWRERSAGQMLKVCAGGASPRVAAANVGQLVQEHDFKLR